jgi:catechol 2,3-dioxygenase-like lactoylglutathione lyase family enzyme
LPVLEGGSAPPLNGVLETALYVEDLERAARFYEDVLGLTALTSDSRFRAYDVGRRSVLLLFRRGATLETVTLPGGTIPPHDGYGPLHIAFAVDDLPAWEQRLEEKEVGIEGRTTWPRGGRSLYVRDPDGHLLEFATRGLWAIY